MSISLSRGYDALDSVWGVKKDNATAATLVGGSLN